jgi:geranylgeranyl pyrophosphate synthase
VTASGGTSFVLHDFLQAERRAVDTELERLLPRLLDGAPGAITEPARYAVAAGGKRLRPILCVAAYRAVAGPPPAGVHATACALELIHTYSLIHDDLPCMDDDDLRRGRPTAHRAFGTAAATLAGAALVTAAARAVRLGGVELGLPPETRLRLVRELATAAGAAGMVGGQWLDLSAEGRRLDVGELERVHRWKTGALLVTSVRLGALSAGAAPLALAALSEYGRALGLAFQITDDLLDVTGATDVLGKTAGRDQALAKATFPSVLGAGEARDRARRLAEDAIAALRGVALDEPALVALARYAVERDR